jgi:hypothetical protein
VRQLQTTINGTTLFQLAGWHDGLTISPDGW